MRLLKFGILFFGAIFFLGLISTVYSTEERSFEQACKHSQAALNQFEDTFNKIVTDTSLIKDIAENKYTIQELSKLNKENLLIYIYLGDSLVFWNNNKVLPEVTYDKIDDGGQLLKKKNGYYFGISKTINIYNVIGLQLIKTDYPIENNYLANSFSDQYPFDPSVEVSSPDSGKTHTFFTLDKKAAFSISRGSEQSAQLNTFSLVSGLIVVFSFWLVTWFAIVLLNRQYAAWVTYLFFIGASVIFIELIGFVDFEFKKGLVFSPQLYASQFYGESFGHLLINCVIVFFLNALIAWHYASRNWRLKRWLFAPLGILAFVQLMTYHDVVKSLILDSLISFEINNFTLITPYTFLGLTIICMLTTSLFISLTLLIQSIRNSFKKKTWTIIAAISLTSMLILYALSPGWLAFILPLLFLLYSIICLTFSENIEKNRFALIMNMFFFAAVAITSVLTIYNQQNESNLKEIAANQLAESRDLITEYQFQEVQQAIKEDPFFRKFFVSPFVSQTELDQRLNYLYFGGHFSKYNLRSFAFNLEGKALKTNSTILLNNFYEKVNHADSTFSESLYLLPQENGKSEYISIIPIENDGIVSGTLVLELSLKTYTKENLYPELLIEQKRSPITQLSPSKDYEYAIYRQGRLVNQSGEYPYPIDFQSLITSDEIPQYMDREDFHLSFFKIDKETIVVINESKATLLKVISTFSYIFFYLTALGFIFIVSIYLLNRQLKLIPLRPIRLTFKNKINLAVALITFASFIAIALITVYHFRDLSRVNNTEKLINKQQNILSNLEYTIASITDHSNILTPVNLTTELATLAEQQSIDINLFSLDGSLLLSSQAGVFGNGLVSRKIDPLAIYHLKKLKEERYIQEEAIGDLLYQSVYVPVRLKSGEAIAFLNLPYFAQQETIRDELSKLMVALLNVYVLLLIISILLAFIISNSITQPLAKISNQMALVEFGSKNERIAWESSDEIGALVDEYNKMILQIEESAIALAQSERESAWREMARQIAHEIKNPLTPMKLSIQHLQRAIKNDPERVPELAERVSKTMVEQIDNLSEIATAFSSFAKMPKANKDQVNLLQLIRNIVALFNQNEDLPVKLTTELTEAWVFADKNQLVSVLNNLVKNAQQATEDISNGQIEISIAEKNENYILAVKDNGIGIAQSMRNKVFVPNFTTKSSGMGLGLAISKQIVENSQGKIWFESEENKGSTFFVTFPKSRRDS